MAYNRNNNNNNNRSYNNNWQSNDRRPRREDRPKVEGLTVEVRNGNLEQALRRLKKMIAKEGIMQEVRDLKHFISNTEKRLTAEAAGKARHRRRIAGDKPK
jgi:ribosomal protein S21